MILHWENLRPVELADRAFLQEALRQHPEKQSCECAEANLFLWRDVYGEKFLPVAGRFWVIETVSGIPHFPIGELFSAAELYFLAQMAAAQGFQAAFYDVPEFAAADPEIRHYFEVTSEAETFDYLYDLRQQAALTGGKLRKKRNLVRQFEQNHPGAVLERITGETLPEALALAGMLNSRLAQADFLAEEAAALRELVNCFSVLDMGGTLLRLEDGSAAGLSLFSRMADGETFDIHFEKADHTVKGAPQVLTAGTAACLLELGGKWMNREQDMGEEGLRQAKRSLDPCGMVRRCYLTAKPEVKPCLSV